MVRAPDPGSCAPYAVAQQGPFLFTGRCRQQGLIITWLTGVAGIVLGGWPSSRLLRIRTLQGLFNLPTCLTANAGAAIRCLPIHLIPSQPGRSLRGRGTGLQAGRHRPHL
jgi:hypothetical protein